MGGGTIRTGRWNTVSVAGTYCRTSATGVPGDDGAGGHGQIPAHLEGAGFDHRRHRAVVADVVDEIAGSPGQAHAAGVEGALEGGRVAHQEVRRRGGAGHDAGRELCLLRQDAAAPVRHRGDDPVQRLSRGEIALLDHPERRVGRPRRIGKTPVASGRSHAGSPPGDAGEFRAQLAGLPGHRRALAQGRSQAAGSLPQRRHPDRLTVLYAPLRVVPEWRNGALAPCMAAIPTQALAPKVLEPLLHGP